MQTKEGQIHERTRSSNLNDSGHVHVHSKHLNLDVSKMTVMMPSKSSQFWHKSSTKSTTCYKPRNTVKKEPAQHSEHTQNVVFHLNSRVLLHRERDRYRDTGAIQKPKIVRNTSAKHSHHPAHIQVHHNPWAGDRS